jgi:NlpC/P60 family
VSFVRAIAAIALLAVASTAVAEDRAPDTGRLLHRTEGSVIADRALAYPTSTPWPDCSHLVHEVLSDAGFEYPYAASNELYEGVPQFRRVRRPQPGDLIVWPGHVGFVVDTKKHRFFSSTTSGPRTDDYQSDYWRGRGVPRFYRYVVTEQTQLVARAPAPEASVAWQAPESLPIESRSGKLSKADVELALAKYLRSSTPVLEAKNRTENAVTVVRRAQVKKVKVKDDLGWAEIRFDSRAQLVPDGTWNKTKAEKVRWSLRRSDDGWQLVLPQNGVYVSESAAIPALEQELSTLSRTSSTTRLRASTLAAVLSLLVRD